MCLIMKLSYLNNVLVNIPISIISYNSSKLVINLNKNLNCEHKEILWNVNEISKININIDKNTNNCILINDYIYKYNISNKDNTNFFCINKNKIINNNDISKKLNSFWFINNLYSSCK